MSPFIDAILGLLVLLLVTTPTVYFGLSRITLEETAVYGEELSYHQSVAIAVLGTIIWGLVSVFFGWIPVIGLLLPPLAWIGVLGWYTSRDWPIAIVVGLLAWVLSALAYRGVGIITF